MSPSAALEQLRHEIAAREDLRRLPCAFCDPECDVCTDLVLELLELREALRCAEAWP